MKLIIIGGVAGGAAAATRARRLSEDAEIILFERGPDVSFATGPLSDLCTLEGSVSRESNACRRGLDRGELREGMTGGS
jgi:NADPH-dependent 2,4-dienoyl-CoA reductase/sulfur reductase-like enzyme